MDTNLRNLRPYRRWRDGITVSILTIPFFTGLGFFISSKSGLLNFDQNYHLNYLIGLVFGQNSFSSYFQLMAKAPLKSILWWLIPIFGFCLGVCLTISELRLREPFIHLRGRQFLTGRAALKSAKLASKKMLIEGRKGFELLPNIRLSREKELQSILIIGAQGGGKTVILNNILHQLIKRNDKLIVYDLVKADYTSWIPSAIILGVTDARSYEWVLGRDLLNLADASTFASSIIPHNEKDPIWSNSSQSVLIALILKLQQENNKNWSWLELNNQLYQNAENIKTVCERYYPPAVIAVADFESKTTQSILINLHSFCSPIFRLAQTYNQIDKKRKIGLKAWLNNDGSKLKNVIIQGDKSDNVLSAALSRAITNVCTNHISSLSFPESKTRAITFVLDEFPQAGKLETISSLLEIGRSKGVNAIIAAQDISQVRQIYGQEEEAKLLAMTGIKIFPKVQGSLSTEWVCDQVGEREVQILNKNINTNASGQSISLSNQKSEIPVLLPSQIETEFGKDKNGINALVLGIGDNALKLHFKFPKIEKLRSGFIPRPNQFKSKKQEQSKEAKTAQINNQVQKTEININDFFDKLETKKEEQTEQANIIFDNKQVEQIEEKEDGATDEILGESVKENGIEIAAEIIDIDSHLIEVADLAVEFSVANINENEPQTIKPNQPKPRKRHIKEREA